MRSPILLVVVGVFALSSALHAQKPREHDLKLPIGGTPGPNQRDY